MLAANRKSSIRPDVIFRTTCTCGLCSILIAAYCILAVASNGQVSPSGNTLHPSASLAWPPPQAPHLGDRSHSKSQWTSVHTESTEAKCSAFNYNFNASFHHGQWRAAQLVAIEWINYLNSEPSSTREQKHFAAKMLLKASVRLEDCNSLRTALKSMEIETLTPLKLKRLPVNDRAEIALAGLLLCRFNCESIDILPFCMSYSDLISENGKASNDPKVIADAHFATSLMQVVFAGDAFTDSEQERYESLGLSLLGDHETNATSLEAACIEFRCAIRAFLRGSSQRHARLCQHLASFTESRCIEARILSDFAESIAESGTDVDGRRKQRRLIQGMERQFGERSPMCLASRIAFLTLHSTASTKEAMLDCVECADQLRAKMASSCFPLWSIEDKSFRAAHRTLMLRIGAEAGVKEAGNDARFISHFMHTYSDDLLLYREAMFRGVDGGVPLIVRLGEGCNRKN